MRTLERGLPGWLKFGRRQPAHRVALYLSNSVAAAGVGRWRGDVLTGDLVAAPIDSVRAAAPVLRDQARRLGFASTRAQLVLAPEFYSLSLVERPPVADEELREAVRWRLQDSLDFPVDQATLDVFELPAAAARDRPMLFVAAIRTDFLRRLVDELSGIGLELEVVDIAELSLRNLVHHLFPGADQGVALLRITSSSGLINISRGEELFLSRRVSGVPGEFDEDGWAQFHERLALQVQRSVDYYESAMNQPPCSAMLVASTHGWQARVTEYLQEMLPIPVRSIGSAFDEHFELRLHNPEPELLDLQALSVAQSNALAAALPALGGLIRAVNREALPA